MNTLYIDKTFMTLGITPEHKCEAVLKRIDQIMEEYIDENISVDFLLDTRKFFNSIEKVVFIKPEGHFYTDNGTADLRTMQLIVLSNICDGIKDLSLGYGFAPEHPAILFMYELLCFFSSLTVSRNQLILSSLRNLTIS